MIWGILDLFSNYFYFWKKKENKHTEQEYKFRQSSILSDKSYIFTQRSSHINESEGYRPTGILAEV